MVVRCKNAWISFREQIILADGELYPIFYHYSTRSCVGFFIFFLVRINFQQTTELSVVCLLKATSLEMFVISDHDTRANEMERAEPKELIMTATVSSTWRSQLRRKHAWVSPNPSSKPRAIFWEHTSSYRFLVAKSIMTLEPHAAVISKSEHKPMMTSSQTIGIARQPLAAVLV